MLKMFFVTMFVCISSYISAQHYELSICTIFRDDAKYLPEWIDFHLQQGVEHFYLYDNLSTDNPEDILRHYIREGIVTLKKWPYEQVDEQDWIHIQCSAYMDCIKRHRRDKWIAFLDTDEFLFSPSKYNLKRVLKGYDQYSGVGVNWVMYGTGNIEKLYPNEKMIDTLVLRGELNQKVNCHVKTIVQPRRVKNCVNPHFFIYDKGHSVTENKQFTDGCQSNYVSVDILRINHYWQRDLEFFWNVKVPRRMRWGATPDQIQEWKNLYNDVYDPIIAEVNYISEMILGME